MADLGIRSDQIRAALDSYIESFVPADVAAEEIGYVTETADGIAKVEGLPGAMATWAASLIPWGIQSTGWGRSPIWKVAVRWNCRHRA